MNPILRSMVLATTIFSPVLSPHTNSLINAQKDGPPDLSLLSSEDQAMIARACNVDRQFNGPAKYYNCLRSQVDALRNSRGEPDLSRLSADEQAMIGRACNVDRQFNGPAK